ncbi:MAG TPA: hypothetical protein VGC76_10880 [Pyrinomonadaceae bacterium]|jgi:hypothetical protein
MLIATLLEKRRLFRRFNVVTPEGIFEVIYDGGRMGGEAVLVEGEIGASTSSDLYSGKTWFAPKFRFKAGSLSAVIEVNVEWRMSIDSFALEVDGQQLYVED